MLDEMLARIGIHDRLQAGTRTLHRLHRAWRRSVPYENLDIQLGHSIHLDDEAMLDKIVRRGRGGYCYEQNGALALLLRAAGFTVTMVEAAVLRATQGDDAWGNHTVLLVDVDEERWVADAGIGDGFLAPLPLRPGVHRQDGATYRLERLDPDVWRFHHRAGGSVASYDFRLAPRQLADFAGRSAWLSRAPDSVYVNTLVVARPVSGRHRLLISRALRGDTGHGEAPRTIETVGEFADVLRDTFRVPLADLGPGAVQRLWERASAQHERWRTRVLEHRG